MKKITFALVMLLCLLKGDGELPKTWNRKYWAFERRPFSWMTFFDLKISPRFYITLRSTPTNGFRLECQYSKFSAVPYVTFWTQQNLDKVQSSLRWLYVLVAWIPNNQVHVARVNAYWASCRCYVALVVFLSTVKKLPVCSIGHWYGKNRQRFGSKMTQVVELLWLNLVRSEFFVWFVRKCVWVVVTIVQLVQTKEHKMNIGLFKSMSLISYRLTFLVKRKGKKLQEQQQLQQNVL